MFLPKNEGGDFTPAPQGFHRAVCTQIVDYGTQESTWMGQVKHQRKVRIAWELENQRMSDGRRFMVSKLYTWSMYEKASLRKDLESWRGVRFKDSDFGHGGFNVKDILGVGCSLNILHEENDGKTYANITAITPIDKPYPEPEEPLIYFSLDPEFFDRDTFESLPDWQQERISKSPEYRQLMGSGEKSQVENRRDSVEQPSTGYTDDIPF